MKELYLIDTNIGHIPVVLSEKKSSTGKIFYVGTVVDMDGIHIVADSVHECRRKLKTAIEVAIHLWMRFQLIDLCLSYESDV